MSFRKYAGKVKDATSVGMAKANSQYKDLDIAVVKATNHIEGPPKEKHVRTILAATSAARPRADVAYLITALARRLAKTHNWIVALKSLMVIHRCLREGDPTFRDELVNFSRSRSHLLNMSHFKDDSSPTAWDFSSWVRAYAQFLEERLECYRVLKYDVENERSSGPSKTRELDTPDLLEQLPALQQALYRLMECQPSGASASNFVIESALGLVLKESFKLYRAINDGIINLVDKFFDMQRHDAQRALDIYKRAGTQAERLAEFYEACKNLNLGRNLQFPSFEQPPTSFLTTMEDYVRDAPRASPAPKEREREQDGYDDERDSRGPPLRQDRDREHLPPRSGPPSQRALPAQKPPLPVQPVAQDDNHDLLGMGSASPENVKQIEEQNALALAIVPAGQQPSTNGTASAAANSSASAGAGWELAIVPASTSDSQKIGNFDKLTLDSLYEDAISRRSPYSTPPGSFNAAPAGGSNPFVAQQHQDPFAASSKYAPPPGVQMAQMRAQQEQLYMQQRMMGAQPQGAYNYPQQAPPAFGPNPFGNPYASQPGPYQNNPFGNPGLL